MRNRTFVNPRDALRDTPVTSTMCLLLSVYCFWQCFVLTVFTQYLPPERLVGYHGPLSITSIPHWGHAYLAAGCVGLIRLCVRSDTHLNLVLHLVSMSVLLAWAVAFDLGPATTGQPSYSFVAVVSFGSAFIIRVVERRYGSRPQLTRR